MRKTYVYIVLFVSFISIAASIFISVNRTVTPTQNREASFDLIAMQSQNKLLLTKNLEDYNHLIEKVITFSGTVKKIENSEGIFTLTLNDGQQETGVLCTMQKDQNNILKTIKYGDKVNVKGVYKGFLTDMIVLNCIVIE